VNTSILPPAFDEEGIPGEDLASLACDAAIELDNLILDRAREVAAVRKLSDRLAKELPDAPDFSSLKHLVDPSTLVVMSRAILETPWAGQASEVQELTRAAGKIAQRLLSVSSDPGASRADIPGLEQLRTFCLALSRRAAAARGSAIETKTPHPYRKQG
jgi:hypothetical protein